MKELFIELAERTLRFDGVSLLYPEQVQQFLLRGLKPNQIRVTVTTKDHAIVVRDLECCALQVRVQHPECVHEYQNV